MAESGERVAADFDLLIHTITAARVRLDAARSELVVAALNCLDAASVQGRLAVASIELRGCLDEIEAMKRSANHDDRE